MAYDPIAAATELEAYLKKEEIMSLAAIRERSGMVVSGGVVFHVPESLRPSWTGLTLE